MPVRARVGLWFVDLDARRLDLDRILITALAGAVPSPCGWQLARSLIFAAG